MYNDDTHFHFEISSSVSVHARVSVCVIEKQYLPSTFHSYPRFLLLSRSLFLFRINVLYEQ